jgi:nucleotide sugar dehydrogenase
VGSIDEEGGMKYDLAVIGLGYVGLPVAIAASAAGLRVLGIDRDENKVASLLEGASYIEDITDAQLEEALSSGFTARADFDEVGTAAAVSISVPTPLRDGLPDLAAVEGAARAVGERLVPGQLVVLESTTYPGTTEEVVKPILEASSGLRAGRGFHLAFSPERIDPGNREWTITNTPKLVGGIDEVSGTQAELLYRKFCDEVVTLSGTREAEMAKLLENTYRHINIALVNEMAIFCAEMGIDIWEAIRGAATKPFGFEAFYPGPGVGGHCIPIDPAYLSYRVRQLGYPFRFVELAQEINARMPRYVVDRAAELLNGQGKALRGSSILVVGVAYKPNVADMRQSPALEVLRILLDRGAVVRYCDPHVPRLEVAGRVLESCDEVVAAAAEADLVLVITPHDELDLQAIAGVASLALDTRGSMAGGSAERL